MHGKRFGVASVEAPLLLPRYRIRAVMTKAAAMDAGVAWLFDTLGAVMLPGIAAGRKIARRGPVNRQPAQRTAAARGAG